MPLSSEEIDACFESKRSRIRYFSLPYAFALILCAFASVGLFCAYFAVVAGIAFGSSWGAKEAVLWIFSEGYGIKMRVAVALVAIGVALSMINISWSMAKVLFLRPTDDRVEVELTESSEPALMHLIHQVAKRVGAKGPTRVFLTGGICASASTGGCFRSLVGGVRELRLGMSLFPALPVDSIGGIIAHECGHFSQSIGSRLRALVIDIGECFARSKEAVEYQIWEERCSEEWSFHEFVNGIGYSIIRYVLGAFAWVAAAIVSLVSRRGEFLADAYEIAFAGSEKFTTTSLTLERLGHTYHKSLNECDLMYRSGKLPDNFPAFVQKRLVNLTDQELALIDSRTRNSEVHVLSSHPTTPQRIAAAERRNKTGIFSCDRCGTELFQNFEERARFLTFHFYDIECGIQVFTEDLVPVEAYAKESKQLTKAFQNQAHHYGNSSRLMSCLPVNGAQFKWLKMPFHEFSKWIKLWEDQVDTRVSELESAHESLQSLLQERHRWNLLYAMAMRGLPLPPDLFANGNFAIETVHWNLKQIEGKLAVIRKRIAPVQQKRVEHSYLTLNVLSRPELVPEKQQERERAAQEYTALLKTLEAFSRSSEMMENLQLSWETLTSFTMIPDKKGVETLGARVATRSTELRRNIEKNFSGLCCVNSSNTHETDFGRHLKEIGAKSYPDDCPVQNETHIVTEVLKTLSESYLATSKRLDEMDRVVSLQYQRASPIAVSVP